MKQTERPAPSIETEASYVELQTEDRCILVRDPMGLTPLYYYLKGNDFAFAEDLRELCARPGADLAVNETWFYLEMSGANSLSLTETEFRYIHAVRPGSRTTFERTGDGWNKTEGIYWEPGRKKIRFSRDEDYIREMRRLIEQSIRKQLDRIEGPVGAEASGGLDSGVIDVLLSRMGRDVHYVSWSQNYEQIPKRAIDERQVVEDIMEQEGKTFHFLPEAGEETDGIARFLPPFVNTLQLSRTSKLIHELGANTVFTGHGGDEGVSHRSNVLELWVHHEYGAYLKEIWLQNKGKKLRLLRTVKQILWGVMRELPGRKKSWQNKDMDLRCCMTESFLEKQKDTRFPPLCFGFDPVKYILQGGSRSRVDNCAVQAKDFGVRYIFPFLDPEVVDFAVSIPRRLYRKNGQNRWIYREAFKDLMPRSLYEVNYKDFPSLREMTEEEKKRETEKPEEQPEKKPLTREEKQKLCRDWATLHLDPLDWNRWSAYFDRDKCEKLLTQIPDELNDSERQRMFILASRLYTCALLQNLQDHAGKWMEQQRGKNTKTAE